MKYIKNGFRILALLLFLTGCGGDSQEEPTDLSADDTHNINCFYKKIVDSFPSACFIEYSGGKQNMQCLDDKRYQVSCESGHCSCQINRVEVSTFEDPNFCSDRESDSDLVNISCGELWTKEAQ